MLVSKIELLNTIDTRDKTQKLHSFSTSESDLKSVLSVNKAL